MGNRPTFSASARPLGTRAAATSGPTTAPRSSSGYTEVLLQAGASAAVPYLKELVEDWSAAAKPSRRSSAWREIASLTKRVIQEWPVDHSPYSVQAGADGKQRSDMLDVLRSAGDGGNRELREVLQKLGPDHASHFSFSILETADTTPDET